MYAIITVCIFDLLVLGDLMMCILFYDDQQEHELKYKFNTLVCTVWFSVIIYFRCAFLNAWYVQIPTQSVIYIGDKSGRNADFNKEICLTRRA